MKKCNKCKTELPETSFYKRGAERNFALFAHCKVCNLKNWQRINEEHKDLVFNKYGKICNCCGEKERVFLSIDHIEDNGAQHRKTFGGSIFRWLIHNNYPSGFQTLCFNCNWAKSHGGCPHKIV